MAVKKPSQLKRKQRTLKEFIADEPIYSLAGVAFLLTLIIVALLAGQHLSRAGHSAHVRTTGFAQVLELNVVDVDWVIAKQFGLADHTGVLVNEIPTGSARRLVRLKRGDIIKKYNAIQIQSAHHLGHLMSQSKPGEKVQFSIFRGGEMHRMRTTIPYPSTIDGLFRPTVVSSMVVIGIFALTFTCLFLNVFNRLICVVMGAVLMLACGSLIGFYNQSKAFAAIQMSPILILIGMSIFSIILGRLKFFDYAAKSLVILVKGQSMHAIIGLCLLTYVLSMLMNNLTTILVIIPITLGLCHEMKLPPVPVLVAEIIASNIGGASTMIGDFPNIVISTNTGLQFMDFLIFMMPICAILLASLFWYLRWTEFSKLPRIKSPELNRAFLNKLSKDIDDLNMDWPAVHQVLFILSIVILCLIFLPAFGLGAATITLGGGFLLLALNRKDIADVIKQISFIDIIFFIALFILVGGALHSGLLEKVSGLLDGVAGANRYLYTVYLLWGVALVTAFLNAGPASVFFIPVVMQSPFASSSDIVWWALALGILVGSSATLTGATAGIVTQTITEEDPIYGLKATKKYLLTFGAYSRIGAPVAGVMLFISTIYIIFLCSLPIVS
ncbi:MAG: Na+/H+ antiporter NhaD/arsenite permease-like protein [Candidatus Omnitrophota bacterium]|jgi:Na+/H+ antiporter NhaD/arsenite permease-like protein